MTTRAPSAAQNARNAPGTLGDRDRQQRLAPFAELGALGHETQPIEVHVGAAQHGGQPLPAHVLASPRSDFSPASASAPAGSAIVRVSSKMSLIAAQISSLVTRMISLTVALDDRERVLADLLHRDAVGEHADLVEPHAAAGRQRLRHRVRIHRLDADDLHVGLQRLDVGADAGDQPAAADRHEHGRQVSGSAAASRRRPSPVRRSPADRRTGWTNDEAGVRREPLAVLLRLGVAIADQHDLRAERLDRVDLDLRASSAA